MYFCQNLDLGKYSQGHVNLKFKTYLTCFFLKLFAVLLGFMKVKQEFL